MVKLTSWLFESRAHAAYTVKDSGNFCCKVIISWGTGEMWGRKKIQYFLIWFLAPLRGLTYGRWHPPFWNSFWVLKGKAILKSEMVKGPEKLRLPGQFIMTILRLFSRLLPPPKANLCIGPGAGWAQPFHFIMSHVKSLPFLVQDWEGNLKIFFFDFEKQQ